MHRRAAGAGNIADIIKCCLKDITMIHAFIKKGSFQDSVSLMLISRNSVNLPRSRKYPS